MSKKIAIVIELPDGHPPSEARLRRLVHLAARLGLEVVDVHPPNPEMLLDLHVRKLAELHRFYAATVGGRPN